MFNRFEKPGQEPGSRDRLENELVEAKKSLVDVNQSISDAYTDNLDGAEKFLLLQSLFSSRGFYEEKIKKLENSLDNTNQNSPTK